MTKDNGEFCVKCKLLRSSHIFSNALNMYPVPENKICDDCISMDFVDKLYRCIECGKRRNGINFLYKAKLGQRALICKDCRTCQKNYDLMAPEVKKKDNQEKFIRNCLKCDKKIIVENKFIRRCQTCRESKGAKAYDQWERE